MGSQQIENTEGPKWEMGCAVTPRRETLALCIRQALLVYVSMNAAEVDRYRQEMLQYYTSAQRPYQLFGLPDDQDWFGGAASNPIPRLREKQKVFLTGAPGTGKTSYLDELARQQASQPNGLPLFLSMRMLSSSLTDLISSQLERFGISAKGHEFMRLSDSDQEVIVLLDGLDEVAPSLAENCIKDIKGLTKAYPKARFVVSSRQPPPQELREWPVIQIPELSDQQIAHFLRAYGIESETSALFSQPELLAFARKPLYLFTAAAAVKQGLNPKDYLRSQLRLYAVWRGHTKSLVPLSISPTQLDSLLEELGFQIVNRNKEWLTRTEGLQIIAAANPSGEDAATLLEAIEATDPIQTQDRLLRFRHKSYCVVYAARALEAKLADQRISREDLSHFLSATNSSAVLEELFQTAERTERESLFRKFPPDLIPRVIASVPSIVADLMTEPRSVEPRAQIAEAFKQLRDAESRIEQSRRDIVVLLIHGFNTRGIWKNEIVPLLGRETDGERFIVHPWDYGKFRLGILSPWARRAKLRDFQQFYNSVVLQYNLARVEICAIGHSFGAYIIGRALLRFPEVRFNRLILLGSALPRKFPWDSIRRKCVKVLNEVFGSDFAVIWAMFVPGLGASGRYGFRTSSDQVVEVKNPFGNHSDGFGPEHMRQTWIPFLRDGSVQFPYDSETAAH